MGRKADIKRASAKDKETPLPATPEKGKQHRSERPLQGCPIPDPIQCLQGSPLAPGEEGRNFICTNTACPYKNVQVHDRCFQVYEDHLVKVMSQLGSARRWTDGMRRENLWEKKGQGLVGRLCRCRCALGNVCRDEQHDVARATREREALEAQQGVKKKKAKKESNLPRLNPGGINGKPAFSEPKRRQRQHLESESESEVSSSFASEYVAARRDSMPVYKDCGAWAAASKPHSEPAPVHLGQQQEHFDYVYSDAVDETMSLVSECDKEVAKFAPAPLPAPLTKSFAAAISASNENAHVSKSESSSAMGAPISAETEIEKPSPAPPRSRTPLSIPLSVQTDILNGSNGGADSGIEMKSSTTSVSDGDHPSPPPSVSAQSSLPSTRQSSPPTITTKINNRRATKEKRKSETTRLTKRSYASASVEGLQKQTSPEETVAAAAAAMRASMGSPIPAVERLRKDDNLLCGFDLPKLTTGAPVVGLDLPPGLPLPPGLRINDQPPPGLVPQSLLNAGSGDAQIPPSPPMLSAVPFFNYDSSGQFFTSTPIRPPNLHASAPTLSNGGPTAVEISFAARVPHPLQMSPIVSVQSQTKKGTSKSISKKIIGGQATSKPAVPIVPNPAAGDDSNERPVTPNNWEDQVPDFIDLSTLPIYEPFGSASFFLGETILAQSHLPGYW